MMAEIAGEQPGNVARLRQGGAAQPSHSYRGGGTVVRIHLLGSMRATCLNNDILPRGRKARAILGYLALAAGERVPRARLASMLWDRAPDAQARTNFRQALRELASAMGALADQLIAADRETVRLSADLCCVDAIEILAPNAVSPGEPCSYSSACRTGVLLEEFDGISASFDQWLLGERTRFAEQLSDQLEAELDRLAGAEVDLRKRISLARRLIAFEPTHEGASRALMRAFAAIGERAQALREFARCRKALRTALDVEPSFETKALCEAIRSYSGRSGYPVASIAG